MSMETLAELLQEMAGSEGEEREALAAKVAEQFNELLGVDDVEIENGSGGTAMDLAANALQSYLLARDYMQTHDKEDGDVLSTIAGRYAFTERQADLLARDVEVLSSLATAESLEKIAQAAIRQAAVIEASMFTVAKLADSFFEAMEETLQERLHEGMSKDNGEVLH